MIANVSVVAFCVVFEILITLLFGFRPGSGCSTVSGYPFLRRSTAAGQTNL